jgi:hypothetical protein
MQGPLRIEMAHWLKIHNMTILILSLFNRTNTGPRDDKAVWPYNVLKFGSDIEDEVETSYSFLNPSRKIKVVLTSDTFHRLFFFRCQGCLSF